MFQTRTLPDTYYVETEQFINTLTAEHSGSGEERLEPLPKILKLEISGLGKRASKKSVARIILNLCSWRDLRPSEVAAYLGRNQDYLRQTYITKLLDDELLDLTADPSNPRLTYETSESGMRWLEEIR